MLTSRACGPFGPSSTWYSTFAPSARLLKPAADRAVVDEDVLATIVLRDEAVTLVVVEPLHGSGCHIHTSFDCVTNVQRKALSQNRYSL